MNVSGLVFNLITLVFTPACDMILLRFGSSSLFVILNTHHFKFK